MRVHGPFQTGEQAMTALGEAVGSGRSRWWLRWPGEPGGPSVDSAKAMR